MIQYLAITPVLLQGRLRTVCLLKMPGRAPRGTACLLTMPHTIPVEHLRRPTIHGAGPPSLTQWASITNNHRPIARLRVAPPRGGSENHPTWERETHGRILRDTIGTDQVIGHGRVTADRDHHMDLSSRTSLRYRQSQAREVYQA